MRNYLTVFITAMALVAVAASAQSGNQAGLSRYGYPYVVGTLDLQAGAGGTLTVPDQYTGGKPAAGSATITIPAGEFSVPVKFEVLAAANMNWDNKVAPNQKVVANFAYRVINEDNGQLIEKFARPVTYTVQDPMITGHSVYWATTESSPPKIINANKATTIAGHTLTHPQPVASVGWIITTPKKDLSSSTSVSMTGGY